MPFPGGKLAPALMLHRHPKEVELPSGVITLTAHAPMFVNAPPTAFTDPSGWTLVGEWDTRDGTGIDGDISYIYGTHAATRGNGFSWNPDGTRITIMTTSSDLITTLNCSTPFDPESAFSVAGNDGETNPGNGRFYLGGTAFCTIRGTGDEISRLITASPYVIWGGNHEHSDITKSDIGYTGASDGFWTAPEDLSYLIWHAPETGSPFHNYIHYVTTPGGDLDNFVLQNSFDVEAIAPAIGQHLSDLSLDQKSFYMCRGSQGISLVTMDAATDIDSIVYGTVADITTQQNSAAGNWNIDSVWIDPNNTRYVWVQGDQGSQQMQLAKFDTTT